MPTNLDKYRKDLDRLIRTGAEIKLDVECYRVRNEQREEAKRSPLATRHSSKSNLPAEASAEDLKTLQDAQGSFSRNYQSWYSECLALLRQLLPDRLDEFRRYYESDPKRKKLDAISYTIQDWVRGLNFGWGTDQTQPVIALVRSFGAQMGILNAVNARFESSLFDIRQLVQADLFDSELDAARELLKHGFTRAAGAVAGVVLEKHLSQVAANHSLKTTKKNPTISTYNDLLKDNAVIDIPVWRQIQRLGDIRNLCDHGKERDPTKEEVDELVSGTDKYLKSLF